MADYMIGPLDEPRWHFDIEDFQARLRGRWPSARITIDDSPDALMCVEAVVFQDSRHSDLAVSLHQGGQFVSVSSADPAAVAQFAVWFARQVPADGPNPHLIVPSDWPPLPLIHSITAPEVAAFLESSPEPGPRTTS